MSHRSIGLGSRASDLWRTYEVMQESEPGFAMRKVRHRRDIFPGLS